MSKRHELELSKDERQRLIELRDTGEPAYLRERAAALLKIAAGTSPHKVALKGLLKKRDPDTVYPIRPGFADTKKRAFKDCFIDRAVAANPRSPPNPPKKQKPRR